MSFQKLYLVKMALVSLCLTVFMSVATAQEVISEAARAPKAIAGNTNLYCAGYIQSAAISTGNTIIGGQDEADRFYYAQNDFVYINMGHNKGVNVGDVFSVVRPRGKVNTRWSRKSGLGFYVQELGSLEVVDVKQEVSVARVKVSCDNMLLGDLVQLSERRTSPLFESQAPLNKFRDASGKATGRILMSRDGAETLTRDFIAYVDLGADDNVKIGDRLTVFRPLAKGNLYLHSEKESVDSRDYGFDSGVYKGGKFSNQASRKSGDKADGDEVTTKDVRNSRPAGLRKVVGEAVVLNVKERTATVVITRTAQEIHTGDWVEIQ